MRKILDRWRPLLPTGRDAYILAGLLLLAVVVIANGAYQARYDIGSDGSSYISLAEHYVRGDFQTAINGYWSPMMSWLIALLMSIGVEARAAFMIINGAAAFVAISVGLAIVWRYTRSLLASSFWLVAMMCFVHNAVGSLFPDMLLLAWLAIFLATLLFIEVLIKKGTTKANILAGVGVGVVGAVGYFIKLYALPFFVVTITCWLLLRLVIFRKDLNTPRQKLKDRLLFPLFTMVTFVVVASPWIALLSSKYDTPTIGSSFAVNTAWVFSNPDAQTTGLTKAEMDGRKVAAPILSPPYETAINISEDRQPSNDKAMNATKKSSLQKQVRGFLGQRKVGMPLYIRQLFTMWFMIIPVAAIVIVWLLIKRPSYKHAAHYYVVGLSFLVYFTGYAIIIGHRGGNPRYFWAMLMLSMLLTGFVIHNVASLKVRYSKFLALFIAIVALGSLLSFYPVSIESLTFRPAKSPLETTANSFKDKYNIEKYTDFLSNNRGENRKFAYHIRGRAHEAQQPGLEFTDIGVLENMEQKDIDYFLHFSRKNDIEFDPTQYGGEVVDRYYLGDSYPPCEDRRKRTYKGPCTLYIIKPITN